MSERRFILSGILFLSLLTGPCGYRRAQMSLPDHIRTLAIPAFHNTSVQYRVEHRFTQAVIEEFLRRTRRVRITSDPEQADAVLLGDIRALTYRGVVLDELGRVRVYEIAVTVGVTLRDLTRHAILFDHPRFVFRGEYEIPEGPESLFAEEGPALDRLAREFARSLVSLILSGAGR
ncbi:MAG: LPS assembly lipoprotein LptE [Blastocatellia bacterium]|nr:LPS assembly lipoprotein LptE [Blastocatellia bacterium]MCS7158251.1 LPS assembly lipoprotein LptE [Blastocatellia bacterium]MCX7753089.1 LPS assembly lipoprotein LptE [Blastocatellia bacterium]MDW8169404.1 LptE family protein [Acidobacteriota bacterium]MDW8256472.1 LptE family protein [Acidobacteriota bacterium]